MISELEKLGKEKEYKYALLETGIKQHEAINLYKNTGYSEISNYGPYEGNINSVCMKKIYNISILMHLGAPAIHLLF